jgi:hypothetical protein
VEIENILKLGTKTSMLPVSCHTRYQIMGSPTQYTQSFVLTRVCQIMYENQIHNTKTSINTVLTRAHCASIRPYSFHKRLKVLLQLACSSSRLLTSCCLYRITDCPMHPVRWSHKPQTSPFLHTRYLHFTFTIAASTAQSGFS